MKNSEVTKYDLFQILVFIVFIYATVNLCLMASLPTGCYYHLAWWPFLSISNFDLGCLMFFLWICSAGELIVYILENVGSNR